MDPIDYYHQQFPADLDFISRAGPYSTRGIISFFTLSPSTVLGLKQVKGCELQEFRSVENKHLFLMCYFFSTILDQAIHFNLRSEHKFLASSLAIQSSKASWSHHTIICIPIAYLSSQQFISNTLACLGLRRTLGPSLVLC